MTYWWMAVSRACSAQNQIANFFPQILPDRAVCRCRAISQITSGRRRCKKKYAKQSLSSSQLEKFLIFLHCIFEILARSICTNCQWCMASIHTQTAIPFGRPDFSVCTHIFGNNVGNANNVRCVASASFLCSSSCSHAHVWTRARALTTMKRAIGENENVINE